MKKVLIVDDSQTILMSMEAILSKAGHSVLQASSGEKALAILKTQKPDLMITDLHMPVMDGIQLVRETRKLTGYRFMPILFLTTESHQDKRTEAKAAGATGWLVKPVAPQDLLGVLKQVLPN